MKVISSISIQGFRSIRDANIQELGHLSALAGLNNSGKSNVLRALNAFFTGDVEPGKPLVVSRDYYRPDLAKKKARRIRISVHFSLPPAFKFRKGLEAVADLLGDDFELSKEWAAGRNTVNYSLNGQTLALEDQRKVEQFLGLISFRYVPNRVLPLEVIRSEHQALRDALVRRVTTRAKSSRDVFEVLRDTSVALIRNMAERVRKLEPHAGTARLATPADWSDMVFAFGYMLEQGGTELEDELQGSGLQSLLMLETLLLIDQDYFQKFGWRQAAIWAIEEPESSLHTSLEVQVAALLRQIANAPKGRLQIICTTHSDLVLQHADQSALAEGDEGGTRFTTGLSIREVLDRAARAGVSRWVHPLLYYPLEPLVLVEGMYDRVFLEEAFRVLRPSRAVRVADVGEMGEAGGGVNSLLEYVKSNAAVIKARTPNSPVVVLLDWEVASKEDRFKRLFASEDPFRVMSWPEDEANPSLDTSFRGIERFYSDRLIDAALEAGFRIGTTQEGVRMVQKGTYGALKRWLSEKISREGLMPDDLRYVKRFLGVLLDVCEASPSTAPESPPTSE